MDGSIESRGGFDVTASTGHLIRRAAQRYASLWNDLVPGDLTSPQFGVLAILHTGRLLDQQTIGVRGGLDKSTCGYLIDRLQQAGLVHAEVDGANRRRKLVSLTAEGHARLIDALPFQRRVQEAALAELTTEDRAQLHRLLLKMLGLPTDDEERR